MRATNILLTGRDVSALLRRPLKSDEAKPPQEGYISLNGGSRYVVEPLEHLPSCRAILQKVEEFANETCLYALTYTLTYTLTYALNPSTHEDASEVHANQGIIDRCLHSLGHRSSEYDGKEGIEREFDRL